EESSASLRELRRLRALLTSRTSDARAQMVVLGMAPPALYWGFGRMDPGFFDPLYDSAIGNLILAGAIGLWGLSLILARRILKVGLSWEATDSSSAASRRCAPRSRSAPGSSARPARRRRRRSACAGS